jgi:hypothetical protein
MGQARVEGAAGSGTEAERSSSEKTERYISKAASIEEVTPESIKIAACPGGVGDAVLKF